MTIGANQLLSRARTLLSCCASLTDLELAELSETIRTVTDPESLREATLSVNCSDSVSPENMKGRLIYDKKRKMFLLSDGYTWKSYWNSQYTECAMIYSIGCNTFGQVASGTTATISSWVREKCNSVNWCDVSAGAGVAHGIKKDGTLWGWGKGVYGELGDNSNVSKCSPVQEASGSTTWKSVQTAIDNVIALKTDGTLWGWGRNTQGNIGDNSTVSKSSPVQEVSNSTNWSFIGASRGNQNLAIKSDGSLWMWGYNLGAQLGDNSTTSRSSPVREASNSTNWCHGAAGCTSSMGIKSDGTLWMWGARCCGALGDLFTCSVCAASSPVQEISSSTNWKMGAVSLRPVAAAIKTDGSLWTWGEGGANAILALGSYGVNRSSPTREFLTSNDWSWVGFSVGPTTINTLLAVKNGTLWGAGNLTREFNPNTLNCGPFLCREWAKCGNISKVAPGCLHTHVIIDCTIGFCQCNYT